MKKLFYFCSISFLAYAIILVCPSGAFAQSESKKGFEKDSSAKNVIYGNSNSANIATQLLIEKPIPEWPKKQNTSPTQSQSALTGPGKVVTCIMVLSCLFFYFNRKK